MFIELWASVTSEIENDYHQKSLKLYDLKNFIIKPESNLQS